MPLECPLITVVVPTYKKFSFLHDTLSSIYVQDYPRIEILITDDGSDNYDESFIQDLASQAPDHIRVCIIHHPQNFGTVKNLNYAIKQAQGEFICFLGSDDLLFQPATLRTLMDFFQKNTMVVTGQMDRINEDGSPYQGGSFSHPSSLFYRLPCWALHYYMLAQGNIYSAPGAMYRKSFFTRTAFYDDQFKYLEDFPFWLSMLRRGISIGYIPQPVAKYRTGGISYANSEGSFQRILNQEIYQVYVREYELSPNSFWGNILKELIALYIKSNLLDYDTQGIVARHLKHIFWVKVVRKGMELLKRILGIVGS